MAKNSISAIADGIETHQEYLDILREYADVLKSHDVDYEEHDRRADPLTLTLIVTVIVTTAITTSVSEVVKLIIKKLAEKAEKKSNVNPIEIRIGSGTFLLPRDEKNATEAVTRLEQRQDVGPSDG